jgi:hypothetical protein
VPDEGALIRQLQGAWRWGAGSPEGVVDAAKGAIYQRRDGAPGTLLYVKTSVLGIKTGWTPFA